MPNFIYQAKDNQGKTVKDSLIAADTQEALQKLRLKYPLVLSLKEGKAGGALKGGQKIKPESLAQFSRQLATIVSSGTPLVRALRVLGKQFKEKALSLATQQIADYIESGSSFAEGLSRFPGIFPLFYINMVAAGEAGGMLNKILERLAVYLEKVSILRRKVSTAMIYPAAIISVAGIITGALVFLVIPRFKTIFTSLGGALPLPTQIVVSLSDWLRRFFPYLAAGLFLLGAALARYRAAPRGKLVFDRLKLRIPVIGEIIQKAAIARFSRTFATLLKGGVPILEALSISAKAVGNSAYESSLLKIRQEVRQGQRLAGELEKDACFPPLVVEMIGVGEESGELDSMLEKIAEAYEEEVDVACAGLVSLIEPLIIIFLGVVVGGIVVAMFLPILKITQMMGK